MPLSQPFPQRLRIARTARGLTQQALAERVSLTQPTISYLETGSNKPSFDALLRLADALSVTTDYLMGRSALINRDMATAQRIHRYLDQG